MEQEHVQLSASANEPLSLPHFVEERAAQLARPVVPFEELRATNRSRKLLLTGALIVAAAVGAVTASFIYSQRSELEGAVTEGVESNESVSPTGDASGSSLGANSAAAQPSAPPNRKKDSAVTEINKQNTVNVKKPVVREGKARNTSNAADDSSRERNWDDRQSEEEMERRSERRDARRLKRERRADQRRTQDLTRIREIFEGSPRP